MSKPRPTIVVIAGPNGAGKTTVSRAVLADTLGITEFVNADTLAAGLSGFDPQRAAFAAGRIMLQRLRDLAAARTNFAFESTLASRTFAPWLARLIADGWELHIIYIWLRSPELAIRRVAARIRRGGHAVPPEIIRRRFARSATNFWHLYRPLAASWHAYDNSGTNARLIAHAQAPDPPKILDPRRFARLMEQVNAHPTPPEDRRPDHG